MDFFNPINRFIFSPQRYINYIFLEFVIFNDDQFINPVSLTEIIFIDLKIVPRFWQNEHQSKCIWNGGKFHR